MILSTMCPISIYILQKSTVPNTRIMTIMLTKLSTTALSTL